MNRPNYNALRSGQFRSGQTIRVLNGVQGQYENLSKSEYLKAVMSQYGPDDTVCEAKIENEPWHTKIVRGFSYSAGGLWNKITGAVSGAWDTFTKDPIGSLGGIANIAVNTAATIAKTGIWAMLNPWGALQKAGEIVMSGINAYGRALQEDPWGTLAKTAMVVGGAVLIATGVGAPAGAILIGTTLSIGGAAALFAQDSYEYATARTERELKERAEENEENIVYEIGGIASGGGQILSQSGKIGNYMITTRFGKWLDKTPYMKETGNFVKGGRAEKVRILHIDAPHFKDGVKLGWHINAKVGFFKPLDHVKLGDIFVKGITATSFGIETSTINITPQTNSE